MGVVVQVLRRFPVVDFVITVSAHRSQVTSLILAALLPVSSWAAQSATTEFACKDEIAKLSTPVEYEAAMNNLEAHAASCVPEFSAALKDPSTSVHKAGSISGILCRMKNRPTEVNELFIALATSAPSIETRRVATYGLACLPTESAVVHLRDALESPDVRIRQNAVRSFSGSALLVRRLLPELLVRLRSDESEEVRCWSAEATESLGTSAIRVLPALQSALKDRSEYVRECVGETIQLIRRRTAGVRLTPARVERLVSDMGPQRAVETIFSSDEDSETLLRGIASARDPWLHAALRLAPALDAHPGEAVCSALGSALKVNAERTLRFGPKVCSIPEICGGPDVDDYDDVAAAVAELRARQSAVRRLKADALAAQRDECLSSLAAAEAPLRSFFVKRPDSDRVTGDYFFNVDAHATDAAGRPMADVRVSIQLAGPPAYDVLTPVSNDTGYTNAEGVVHFSFISHVPEYTFTLIFFKEGFKTVWLEGLKWEAPEMGHQTAIMKAAE